ncbi:MAG: 50S ribosomal protein L17 [Candidatus Omnitrophota bacterium]
MRHKKKKGRLNRRTSWRKATLKSLTMDLLKYQRIETTMAKAKALRSFAEPLITLAKNNPESVNARRLAFKKLCNRASVTTLFNDIAPLFKDVPGGYTRIMALGNRRGDGARTVIMELSRRSISDDKLLGEDKIKEKKEKTKKGKAEDLAKDKQPKDEEKEEAKTKTEISKKEEHTNLAVKKEKAKTEQKKREKKGLFKRFQRKSI